MRNRQKIFWWENETWKFQKLDSLTQKNHVSFFHLILSQEQRPFSVESQQQQYGRAREDVYHGNPILWALWTQGDQVLQAIDDYCRTQWLWQDDHHRVLEGGLLWRISSSHPSRKSILPFFFSSFHVVGLCSWPQSVKSKGGQGSDPTPIQRKGRKDLCGHSFFPIANRIEAEPFELFL